MFLKNAEGAGKEWRVLAKEFDPKGLFASGESASLTRMYAERTPMVLD